MIAIPMVTSAGSIQVSCATDLIASDLEYAKTLAISRCQIFSVVFDTDNNSYWIEDQSGTIIEHPVKKGFDYIVNFQTDTGFDKVNINNVDFDPGSKNTVTFDYLGCPYSGNNSVNQLTSGQIIIQDSEGMLTKILNVEPVTGFISF